MSYSRRLARGRNPRDPRGRLLEASAARVAEALQHVALDKSSSGAHRFAVRGREVQRRSYRVRDVARG
jgi:hypothetical protein